MKIQNYVLGVILGASLAAALAVLPGNAFAQMDSDIRLANPSSANVTSGNMTSGNLTGAEEGILTANTTGIFAQPSGAIDYR